MSGHNMDWFDPITPVTSGKYPLPHAKPSSIEKNTKSLHPREILPDGLIEAAKIPCKPLAGCRK